jgi:hypothetical protein
MGHPVVEGVYVSSSSAMRKCFTLFGLPFRIDGKADVAQLVEQPIRNRQVSGSSPLVGSILSVTYRHSLLHSQLIVTWIPLIESFLGRLRL